MTQQTPSPEGQPPVILTSCGPSMQPYWKPMIDAGYHLVMTEEGTAQAMRQMNWPVTHLLEYMPRVEPASMLNLVAALIIRVPWDAAFTKFAWKVDNREALVGPVWDTINNWAALRLGGGGCEIDIPPAIRYDMLQWIYAHIAQMEDKSWTCGAENWLPGFVLHNMLNIVPRLLCLDMLSKQRRVHGVVLHEDITNGLQFVAQWAKGRGIPSVHIAHGSYGWRDYSPGEEYNIHRTLVADKVCAWNEAQRNFLLRGGAKPEQVFLTGSGKTDTWAKMKPDRDLAKQKVFGRSVDVKRPVVVYVGTWVNRLGPLDEGGECDQFFADFLEGCKLLPDWRVVVRPHPGTHKWTPEWHRDQMKAAGVKGVVASGQLEPIMEAADVLFSPSGSMLDIEGAIINRASVTYQGMEGYGGATPAFYVYCGHEPQQVADGIRLARGRENTEEWREARNAKLYDEFNVVDGRSTERVMKVVLAHILPAK